MKKNQALMCPKCRRLVSKVQAVCPWCGLPYPGKWFWFGKLMSLFGHPNLVMQGLIFLNVLFFSLSLVLYPKGVHWTLDPFSALSPELRVLVLLGASGTIPVLKFGAWGSLVTAGFLHGGILHLLFNMAALYYLGNLTMQIFGSYRMLLVYLASNVVGFGLSVLGGISVTIGASAAICGLIGALFFYGWQSGGDKGKAVLRHTQGWLIGLVLFGLFVPNINNWGHAGGFIGGFVMAWLLRYPEVRSETMGMRLGAMAASLFCIALLLGNLFFALKYIGPFTSLF